MNKRKLIIAVIFAAVIIAAVFVTFRRNSARARLPEWLSENLQTEIRGLDYNNPEVKLLTSEMQNIYVKDQTHPTQSLIKKVVASVCTNYTIYQEVYPYSW